MTSTILLFILASAVPYYIILEKASKLKSESIFLIAANLHFLAIILSSFFIIEFGEIFLILSLLNAVITFFIATKTTNFYKLGYYLLFINSPIFVFFSHQNGELYSVSLILTLLGIYLIGKFYERNYGSANYQTVTGLTFSTPYIGVFLLLYLITLALYPPFPNSIIFFAQIINGQMDLLWYLLVIILFLSNFILAMRVVARVLFGSKNQYIHYVDFSQKERLTHLFICIILLSLSFIQFKEIVS